MLPAGERERGRRDRVEPRAFAGEAGGGECSAGLCGVRGAMRVRQELWHDGSGRTITSSGMAPEAYREGARREQGAVTTARSSSRSDSGRAEALVSDRGILVDRVGRVGRVRGGQVAGVQAGPRGRFREAEAAVCPEASEPWCHDDRRSLGRPHARARVTRQSGSATRRKRHERRDVFPFETWAEVEPSPSSSTRATGRSRSWRSAPAFAPRSCSGSTAPTSTVRPASSGFGDGTQAAC